MAQMSSQVPECWWVWRTQPQYQDSGKIRLWSKRRQVKENYWLTLKTQWEKSQLILIWPKEDAFLNLRITHKMRTTPPVCQWVQKLQTTTMLAVKWSKSRTLRTEHGSEVREKQNLSRITAGNAKWYHLLGRQCDGFF